MVRIQSSQKYQRQVFWYAGTRVLERAAFYGFRSLIFLYMVKASIGFSNEDALKFYSWFASSFLFSQLLGALLGDLVIGNKKAILLGGLLQAFGMFLFCAPYQITVYVGLGLVTLGSGLFSPNILASYGKLYLNKFPLLDGGYSLFYSAVNLGAIFGALVVGYIGFSNFTYGFILAGILMLISVVIFAWNAGLKEEEQVAEREKRTWSLHSLLCILLLGFFWMLIYFTDKTELISDDIRGYIPLIPSLGALESLFTILIGIVFTVVWSFYYMDHFKKIAIGFVIAAMSYVLFFYVAISGIQSDFLVLGYAGGTFIVCIAEVLMSPILYAILVRNAPSKYLAIFISLTSIPAMLLTYAVPLIFNSFNVGRFIPWQFTILAFGVIALVLGLILIFRKKKNQDHVFRQEQEEAMNELK